MSRQIGWAVIYDNRITFSETCREHLAGKRFEARVTAQFLSLLASQSECSYKISASKAISLTNKLVAGHVCRPGEVRRHLPVYEKRPGLYYIKL